MEWSMVIHDVVMWYVGWKSSSCITDDVMYRYTRVHAYILMRIQIYGFKMMCAPSVGLLVGLISILSECNKMIQYLFSSTLSSSSFPISGKSSFLLNIVAVISIKKLSNSTKKLGMLMKRKERNGRVTISKFVE